MIIDIILYKRKYGFYIQRPVEMKLLKHGGYLGAIGVLVKEDRSDDYEDFVQNVKANWDS